MKTIYIECNAGAAGDMLMAALSELHPDPDDFFKRLNGLGIPGVTAEYCKGQKCGITGTRVSIKINGVKEYEHMHDHGGHEGRDYVHHAHNTPSGIEKLIKKLPLDKNVCDDALAVYDILAQAESTVHGCEIKDIHFHEIGTMDAVADIVGVCMLINEIGADRIIASPVNTGGGFVRCAHGVLPVPAPAAAHILKGIPMYSDNNEGEMCTPTGAALLKHFVSEFIKMPEIVAEKTGYGIGSKDFSVANVLRVFLGETILQQESILEICANIDDMTGEEMAFATAALFKAGARDVFTASIGMKKNRPAVLLTCICTEDKKEAIAAAFFKNTTTLGVRVKKCERYILERNEKTIDTKYGTIRVKESSGFGVMRRKAEYDDLEKAALANDLTPDIIKKELDI